MATPTACVNWRANLPISPARSRRRIDALNAEQAKLESDYQDADELPDEVDQRLGEIEAALMAFEDRSVIYDPADIARAGVFVSIDAEGGFRSTGAMSDRRTRRPYRIPNRTRRRCVADRGQEAGASSSAR